ncbi:MAG: hypothetical protein KIT35_20590 [Piscinibacter sp.]|uniref:hypothetical protein n=1 Tax=Piscinibacter sp. TaxID=1903157 RepID=UPI00259125AC|nr:hypothetical protein [Piscinibacter sp.]MCW5666235.1 hypothetical protein [Piscinibacter sp.]
MRAYDTTRRSHLNRHQLCRQMLAGMLTSLAAAVAVEAADTCKEVATLQAGGESMVSLPMTLVPSRSEEKRAYELASSWKCTSEVQGGDWLLSCSSNWSTEVKLAYELTVGLAKEIRACAGSDWRQKAVRLSEERATTFLYREGESTEFETSLLMREAPSSIGIAEAVGVPSKPTVEVRAELAVIRLAPVRPAGVATSTESDPLCAPVRDIIRHAASDFRGIRGAPTGDKSWVALQALPDAADCSVSDSSAYASYQCTRGSYPNRGALRADQISLTRRMAACLGQPWETALRPRGNGMWVYGLSKKDGDVEVDIRGRLRKERPTLLIEIDREK